MAKKSNLIEPIDGNFENVTKSLLISKNKKLKAIYSSQKDKALKIGSILIPCYVLEGGIRVLSGREMLRVLGFDPGKIGGSLERIFPIISYNITNKDKITDMLSRVKNEQIPFITGIGGFANEAIGYEATLLVDIADLILDIYKESGNNENIKIYADNAEILIRAIAKVGIIALIDEATGYQDVRDKDTLSKLLESWIEKETYRQWTKTFSLDFYKELFRLLKWDMLNPQTQRPGVLGKYTNDIVYDRLAPDLLKVLKEKNPIIDGRRKVRHHQWLTGDIGIPELKARLEGLRILMRSCTDWKEFMQKLDKEYPRYYEFDFYNE